MPAIVILFPVPSLAWAEGTTASNALIASLQGHPETQITKFIFTLITRSTVRKFSTEPSYKVITAHVGE